MKRSITRGSGFGGRSPVSATTAKAELPQTYCYLQSQYLPWHNGYYDPAWGEPYALVVPPTAEFQANYGWGVCGTRVAPIYHQFGRPFPGYGVGGGSIPPHSAEPERYATIRRVLRSRTVVTTGSRVSGFGSRISNRRRRLADRQFPRLLIPDSCIHCHRAVRRRLLLRRAARFFARRECSQIPR